MSKYDSLLVDLAAPPQVTSRERAHAAAAAVQTSLFGRLRKARGSAVAGRLAWMLVRGASPDHVDCAAALDAIAALPVLDLRAFHLAACGARDSLQAPAAAAVAAALVVVLEAEIGRRG